MMPTILDWSSGELAEGLRCYRSRQFFSAHEHWESVWLQSAEPERTFLQALIQVASAFHHFQRHNSRGATGLLKRAIWRLEPYPELFQSVQVGWLRRELAAWLQLLEAHAPAESSAFPQIHFTEMESDLPA
jgi:hypothetical protein